MKLLIVSIFLVVGFLAPFSLALNCLHCGEDGAKEGYCDKGVKPVEATCGGPKPGERRVFSSSNPGIISCYKAVGRGLVGQPPESKEIGISLGCAELPSTDNKADNATGSNIGTTVAPISTGPGPCETVVKNVNSTLDGYRCYCQTDLCNKPVGNETSLMKPTSHGEKLLPLAFVTFFPAIIIFSAALQILLINNNLLTPKTQ